MRECNKFKEASRQHRQWNECLRKLVLPGLKQENDKKERDLGLDKNKLKINRY